MHPGISIRMWLGALVTSTLLVNGPAAPVPGLPQRLLSTGDVVDEFGRVGTAGVLLLAVDNDGRALIIRGDDVSRGFLWWVDEHGIVPAIDGGGWDSPTAGYASSVSPNGNFCFNVRTHGASRNGKVDDPGLFAVERGSLRRIVRVGERDPNGHIVCEVGDSFINDSGAVAFDAYIVPADRNCGDSSQGPDGTVVESSEFAAVFISTPDGKLHLVASDQENSAPAVVRREIRLLSITDDGAAVVSATNHYWNGEFLPPADEVFLASPQQRRSLVSFVDHDFSWIGARTANRKGDVLFAATVGDSWAVYRTVEGAIVRIAGEGDPSPWGHLFENGDLRNGDLRIDPGGINQRGDVLLRFARGDGLYLVPADGPPRTFAEGEGKLDEMGDVVAFEVMTASQVRRVVRWRGSERTVLATTGDPLPDGGFLLDGSLASRCVGPAGSAAAVADSSTGETGLLCVDATGAHVIAKAGDVTPVGKRFYGFSQCQMQRAGEIVFIGENLVETSSSLFEVRRMTWYEVEHAVYRAREDRIERVIGRGDVTSEGHVVQGLAWFPLWSQSVLFDSDASGRVLAFAWLAGFPSSGAVAVVRETDGTLRRVPLEFDGPTVSAGRGVGFFDDSIVDHRFLSEDLSGSQELRSDANPMRSSGAATGEVISSDGTGRNAASFRVAMARLGEHDDVWLLAAEQHLRGLASSDDFEIGVTLLLRWSHRGLETIYRGSETQITWDRWDPTSLLVANGRVAFDDGYGLTSRVLLHDTRNNLTTEVARHGVEIDGALIATPSLRGLSTEGDVYVKSSWEGGEGPLLAWMDGRWRLFTDEEFADQVKVSTDVALLYHDPNALWGTTSAAMTATCPTRVAPAATASSASAGCSTRGDESAGGIGWLVLGAILLAAVSRGKPGGRDLACMGRLGAPRPHRR